VKPGAAPSSTTSAEAFAVIRDYIEKNGDLAGQIGKTYLFKLTGPDSAWTIDLKNGKGSVAEGGASADCTLEMSDSDFRDMVAGKADAQKLYFGGKLKISGDVMASQKLMFLKKIDPARALEVVKKLRGAGGGGAKPAAAAAAPAAPTRVGTAKAPAIFAALGERLAKNPGWVKEVSAVVQFVVTGPDGAWTADLKNGSGSVKQGTDPKADVTLKISDDDLAALAKDGNLRDLYQHGQIRVDGDVRAATRLTILKGLA
jgi:3-hydroxyacyl-CoA dehydrogenase/3a,7a,12a-trihydroxy-5b-cholest-24-enoyl-CoA hydratase